MKTTLFRCAGAASLALVALLAACTTPLGAPAASADNVQRAKAQPLAPSQVGEFKLAPGKSASMDTGVSVRASSVTSPVEGSFAKYLRQTLIVELQAAGLYDSASKAVITGLLLDSDADAGIGTGTARLSARFTVTRDGATAYEKDLAVMATWESSFLGAVAIPAAINEYSGLYRKLVGALLADDDFKRAMAPR